MEPRRNQLHAEREDRKRQAAELLERGWMSTGDVVFKIARESNLNSATMTSKMVEFYTAVLVEEAEEYRSENFKKIANKTFVSPDMVEKIRRKAIEYFSKTKETYRPKT